MTEKNIDELLFTSYQSDFIIKKVAVLKGIIDNQMQVLDIIQGNDGLKFTDEDALISSLKAEIHFSKYHALETMFAIAFALLKQPDDVWEWLSTYKFHIFNEMIDDVSKSGMSAISGESEFDTIQSIFFKNCPTDFIQQDIAKNNILAISKMMILCAKEMADKSEYNSYKHGLRIINGSLGVKVVNDDESEEKILRESPGFVYLNTKNKDHTSIVAKFYSYEKSYEVIKLCWQLTYLMIKQRKIKYSGDVDYSIETIDFNKIDVDEIFENA